MNNIEGFPDIKIFSGGHIPRINEDGRIDNNTYSYNLRRLYQELTTNFKNISAILTSGIDQNAEIK